MSALSITLQRWRSWPCLLGGLLVMCSASAQPSGAASASLRAAVPTAQRSMADWLHRLQRASQVSSYSGTYVVSSANGGLSSARIEHYCDADMQIERVETLTGEPRLTFRRNDQVRTYLPRSRVVYSEQRDGAEFPRLLQSGLESSVLAFYEAHAEGQARVAGLDADVVLFRPKDKLRYGYRIWSEQRTGMIVKIQTIEADDQVLEQSAFSELSLHAGMQAKKLLRAMSSDDGYRRVAVDRSAVSMAEQAWRLNADIPGFSAQAAYRQKMPGQTESVLQWVFSDGLATVSIFIDPAGLREHRHEGVVAMGATHTLTRRLVIGQQAWWVTAVGEVPTDTLSAFIRHLQRN